jgi:penicillin-binding protein 1C
MANIKKRMRYLVPTKSPLDKKKQPFRKKRGITWKLIGKIALICFLVFVFFVAFVFAWFSKDLPTPGNIKKRQAAQSSEILDRNGDVLYQVSGDERRTVIKSDAIPQNVKNATIALEDKDFYHHFGVDFRGVLRAVYYDFFKRSLNIQGGSTITQQFVKNALLSPQRSFTRKVKELILSIEIEAMYSKDDILTMYLNEIPYGSNAYGIEAASNMYFNKSAKDLTLTESTILASLPQSPTYYSPYGSHRDALYFRALHCLDEMQKQGYITEDQKIQAQAPIKNKQVVFSKFQANIKAPHFVFYVREILAAKYGDRLLEEGGLKITTTLDANKQTIAEDEVAKGAAENWSRFGGYNASLVAIDPKTGDVLAMVGGRDYFDIEHDGNVNVSTRPRQPGSAFKPVVYATLFKDKWGPGYRLFDLETDFGGGYKPKDNDGKTAGPVTIREALGSSLNIPAVKALSLAGMDKVLEQAKNMGITTLNQPDRYGLSLVLGGGEVKLLELTGAYAIFADNGIKEDVNPILKIQDSSGKVLEEKQPAKQKNKVVDENIAYEISSILSDNNAKIRGYGSVRTVFENPDHPYAAKTGTTSDYRDGWTIGYTPSLVGGVWVGNNDNAAMNKGYGSLAASPIWRAFMDRALAGTPREDFARPSSIQDGTIDKLSNTISNGGSNSVKDIFAPWQIPTEKGGYTKVKIDKLTGQRAKDGCPEAYVEERTFVDIHSERPDVANWENPVRAWAASQGLLNPPPEGDATCAALDGANRPIISITSPSNGETISGTRTIKTSVNAPLGVKTVEFYIDNVNIGTTTSSPYQFAYNFNNLSSGAHTIKVRVVDNANLSGENSINVNVGSDTTPPGNVTNLNASGSPGHVLLTWTNPSDSDFAYVRIYRAAGACGGGGSLIADNVVGSSFTDTVAAGTYCYTVKSVDTSGNASSGSKKSGTAT